MERALELPLFGPLMREFAAVSAAVDGQAVYFDGVSTTREQSRAIYVLYSP